MPWSARMQGVLQADVQAGVAREVRLHAGEVLERLIGAEGRLD